MRIFVAGATGAIGRPLVRRLVAGGHIVARLLAGPYAVHLMTRAPGASNAKSRATLGWTPERPDWRTGFISDLAT